MDADLRNVDELGPDSRFPGGIPRVEDVYFFVFGRYRQIAKDFILQKGVEDSNSDDNNAHSHVIPSSMELNKSKDQKDPFFITPIWIECHERIARFYILMDNYMRCSQEFVDDHAQQNGEQLNNVLKTLLEYYRSGSSHHISKPNEAEFTAYFILGQLTNGGEVNKV